MKKTELLLLIILYLFGTSLPASNDPVQQSVFDLMNHKQVLDLTLETDLTALKTNRRDESSHKAQITFKDADGSLQAWEIKVRLRGAFRRLKCSDVPPLKLNFKKSELTAAGLAKFDDLKLVPQCLENGPLAKEVLLKEYLTYKMYNELSLYSYRVQLVRITYKDTATGDKDKQWAFLIEDTAQLRHRIGGNKMDDLFNMPADSFHLSQARLVSLFQYMIGNADWGYDHIKNVKFIERKGKVVPVPYDFDFSGLVNAPYALPNSNVGQTSLQKRVYLGFENEFAQLKGMINYLKRHRHDLEELVMDFRPLNYGARLEMVEYLKTFFEGPDQVCTKGMAMAEQEAADRP